ncbi:short-chain dehydrogenase [Ferruginibacter sp. SUN002]|uniref:short-chain dehydrogenase n=1 Tax=Ferruginibacter sp. SUN002 TaxID=2937789 RepID=UPI003D3653B0
MVNDQIENFLSQKKIDKTPVQIYFKTRSSILGLFIQTGDYLELKTKNYWRIVSEANIEEYKKSNDINLTRIFNGVEFTRLVAV